MKKIFPILLALIGVGAGVGAGLMLKPAPVEVVEINPCGETQHMAADMQDEEELVDSEEAMTSEFVKLNNQFVVPVVSDGRIEAMVVMSLSVEVGVGKKEAVYLREPKLRDAFLQVLFDHANMGGFQGAFTNSNNMDILRNALMETARKIMGDVISDVLILDLARQDT
ncbi:MAG: flagellar basal body-associated FliL family protein [Rhodobacterales bacterium]|nr:flagellar basal body-associated FliL family protein [Rhodobacterales bacterium]